MPTFPVRRLGSAGIVPDVFPSDLESVAAFSGGVNVRFYNGRVSRAPVYRTVATLAYPPGHILSVPPSSSGYEEVIIVSADYGKMQRLNGALFEDLTPVVHDAVEGKQPINSAYLGGVIYLNRETHPPLCKRPIDDTFVTLPAWPSGDVCKALRPYKDQLIALGVTKSGSYYPTMVRWSDIASFGIAPASWDPGDPTKSAGENIVNEMTHDLVDGLTLRDSFILYCTSSVWQMDYTGGQDVYVFRKLFQDRGVISQNCIAQVDGLHYVFDRGDIYVHDGVSDPRSIVDGRAKKFIFDALDYSRVHLCFVQHVAKMSEVRFSYCSNDRFVGFASPTTGCNRQAVYNYSNDTWTFDDVPNLVGGTQAALISGDAWEADQEALWEGEAEQWSPTEGNEVRHVLVASQIDTGQGLLAHRVFAHDAINGGLLPAVPIEPQTLKPAIVERTGIDLDAYGKRLTQHVNIQAIWPQLRMDDWHACKWQFGGSNFIALDPSWSAETTFDPATETKIDVNESGKYLSYRFACEGDQDFDLSSFDVQLLIRGRR